MTSPLRVAHIVGSLAPSRGGPGAVAVRLASAQRKHGYEVRVVGGLEQDDRDSFDEALTEVPDPAQIVTDTYRRLTPRILGVLQDLRPHVVHLHGVWEPALLVGALWAKLNGVPYVVRPAGMLDYWSLSQKRLKKLLALHAGYRTFLRNASFLHALTAHEQAFLRDAGYNQSVRLVANGVFMPRASTQKFDSLFPRARGRKILLFLGRLHRKKGLDLLARAWLRIRDDSWCLVIAGPREDDSIVEARRILEGATSPYIETGPIHGPVKEAALQAASAFIIPSRQEGFSVAILEAMAFGLPIVATEYCRFPEIQAFDAGVICRLDEKSIADGIKAVLEDERARLKMGTQGRRLVAERYTWTAVASQLEDYYREAINEA